MLEVFAQSVGFRLEARIMSLQSHAESSSSQKKDLEVCFAGFDETITTSSDRAL